VGVQALAVEEGAVAAAQVPDIQALVVGQAQGGVAAADAHPVARERREVDVGHGTGRRIAPAKYRLRLGLEQDRLGAAFKLQSQVRSGGKRGCALGFSAFRPSGSFGQFGLVLFFVVQGLGIDRHLADQAGATVLAKHNPGPVTVTAVTALLHATPPATTQHALVGACDQRLAEKTDGMKQRLKAPRASTLSICQKSL